MSTCMSIWNSCCEDLTDVTLADEDTNSITFEGGKSAIFGNEAIQAVPPGSQICNQVVPSGDKFCTQCKRCYIFASSACGFHIVEPPKFSCDQIHLSCHTEPRLLLQYTPSDPQSRYFVKPHIYPFFAALFQGQEDPSHSSSGTGLTLFLCVLIRNWLFSKKSYWFFPCGNKVYAFTRDNFSSLMTFYSILERNKLW